MQGARAGKIFVKMFDKICERCPFLGYNFQIPRLIFWARGLRNFDALCDASRAHFVG